MGHSRHVDGNLRQGEDRRLMPCMDTPGQKDLLSQSGGLHILSTLVQLPEADRQMSNTLEHLKTEGKNINSFSSNIPTLSWLWGWALHGHSGAERPGKVWGWARDSGVGHSSETLGWALQVDCGVGHSRKSLGLTLGLGTPGTPGMREE